MEKRLKEGHYHSYDEILCFVCVKNRVLANPILRFGDFIPLFIYTYEQIRALQTPFITVQTVSGM
jgi:hypothetical protein